MSFDRSQRSHFRHQKASRQLKNRRKHQNKRSLNLESLEKRWMMHGGHGDEPDVHASVDLSAEYKWLPPRYYQTGQGAYLTGPASGNPVSIAVAYLQNHASEYGVTGADLSHFVVKDVVTTKDLGTTHIYLKQTYNQLEIANADINVNVSKDGRIISASSSFVSNLTYPAQPQPFNPGMSAVQTVQEFASTFEYEMSGSATVLAPPTGHNLRTVTSAPGVAAAPVVSELQYVATPTGLELVWKSVIATADQQHWYDVYQGANDGGLTFISDWVDKAAYNVFPIPTEGPADGTRGFVIDPANAASSPLGWHDVNGIPGADFTDTRGNNVWAQADRDAIAVVGGTQVPTIRPNGGTNLVFDFPLNTTQPSSTYTDASVVNLFYLTNVAHDVFYRYGFDEASGNFQATNYTQAGQQGDPLLALAQVGGNLGALNNAFMATPPDGFQPMMIMGDINIDVTNLTGVPLAYTPARSTDLVASVVLHEYGHGITNRLTGGPANSNALNAIQSAGMGEGWSDFFALWMLQRSTDQKNDAVPQGDYLGGPLAANPEKGIRRFPYSFDLTVNPLTFKDFNGTGGCLFATGNCEPHNAGEIWASVLWDMNWLLVEKYGFSSDLYAGSGGNNVAMRLVIDALKLQPANPTFLQARDAILQADLMRNGGINLEEIWTAFARRGMGQSADADIIFNFPLADSPNSLLVREGYDIPSTKAFVTGKVWSDANGNGTLEANEAGLANVTVFVDTNVNGIRDVLDPFTTTASDGTYTFDFFAGGTYVIDQEVPAGYQQTFPLNNANHTVTVGVGQTISDLNFGNRLGSPAFGGLVYFDEDGDGRHHPFEVGMPNVYVYADFDNDNRMDIGEPSAVTKSDGTYTFTLSTPGTYFVRQSVPPGYVQTEPLNNAGYQVTLVSGTLNAEFEFGNTKSEDWGDAPSPYPTLSSANGAVHGFIPGFYMGASVDVEAEGAPNATATGDDISPIDKDDEDGVAFTSAMFAGSTSTVSVTINLQELVEETVQGKTRTVVKTDNSPGRLHAWIDFNRDGDWLDAGEKIFNDLLLNQGTHALTYAVPQSAVSGVTYARFRYTYDHILNPTGRAMGGEVEDYQVRILSTTPDAVDDVFSVDQNTVANFLNVLANDVPSSAGELTIRSVTAPSNGGTVLISSDGKSLRYTPRTGFIGSESFNYTVADPSGTTDTARVSVTVLPAFNFPIAVDDSFTVNENSTNNELNVMANDLAGRNPPIGIVSFVQPPNGTVFVDNRGTTTTTDDVMRYTPIPGFGGTDNFQYTIEDANRQQSTGTVTVHVIPGDLDDDLVQFRIELTDINNKPIQAIGVSEAFKVRVYVDDLRPEDGVDDNIDRRGVGAAYLDVLFPFNLVSMGTITHAPEYRNATSGSLTTPGVIDEAGALQTGSTPLGANELLLFEVSAVATGVGTARFVGDPADRTSENPGVPPEHDTLLFEPPNTVPIRQLRFVNGSLEIVGSGGRPQAIDNTFSVPVNSVDFPLDVLANDVEEDNPPLRITAVGSATTTTFTTPNGGRVTLSSDGLRLLYTPRNGFNGTEQFTYTVANAVGLTAIAEVTVQVGSFPKDVNFRLDTVNSLGLHIDTILQGETFSLNVYVQDIRTNAPDEELRGVFAAYLDVLYNGNFVSTIGDINEPTGFRMDFGPEYINGQSASNALPNIIDELGAFQGSFNPLGPGEFLLATIQFRADRGGTVTFAGDPADTTPLHDTLFFEPDDSAVPLSNIAYRTTTITVIGAGEGELRFHNRNRREDVNVDQFVSAMDALLVINELNRNGPRSLLGAGEGEVGGSMMYDVSGDDSISPQDALIVINYLNYLANHAEGEGEGEAYVAASNLVDDTESLLARSAGALNSSGDAGILDVGPPSYASPDSAESQGPPMPANQSAGTSDHEAVFASMGGMNTDSDDDDADDLDTLARDLLDAWDQLDPDR